MEIEEIKKIVLNEGDVLAVRLPEGTNHDTLKVVQENFTKVFPKNRCMIYVGEVNFINLGTIGAKQ